jgi:hypothetical protein
MNAPANTLHAGSTEGKTIREIMRVLKRYVARELYPHLVRA